MHNPSNVILQHLVSSMLEFDRHNNEAEIVPGHDEYEALIAMAQLAKRQMEA